MKNHKYWLFTFLLAASSAHAVEFSGNIALQQRSFINDALDSRQHDNYASIASEVELYHDWDDGNQSLTITPFYRYDQHDEERRHFDIREFSWLKVFDNWEFTLGVSKVYWGVTESAHLVDIINQTDQVENIDGEDKLGQPMLRFSTDQDWGLLDIFILPGFRERTFAGVEGRPRPELAPGFSFNPDATLYESSRRDNHLDFATRWFMTFDEWELALSHFSGTGREPESFIPDANNVLQPYYSLINQTGLELQALIDDWTWKLEMISTENSTERYLALAGGFEYTIVGIHESNADLGIVIEYLFDDRDELASSAFQNDITTAFRLTMNDVQSSEILIGFITDLDEQVVASFIEASRRLGDSFKAELEMRSFNNTVPLRPLHHFRQDDFIQADIAWYF